MDDEMKAMAEGTMFHSVTFGKGQMGSYASQLSTQATLDGDCLYKIKTSRRNSSSS